MHPLAMLAGSRYSHAAGASGTVTVPAGVTITGIKCHSTAGGTLTLTPKGANQNNTAQAAIPIPASSDWFEFPPHILSFGQLGEGTVIAFASTDSYLVTYATFRSGGPA